MEPHPEVVDAAVQALAISSPESGGKQDHMEEDKLQEQIVSSPKRERSKFELEASPSTGLISSLPDQQSSKSRKLEEHSVQASSAAASSRSVILRNRIQLVKDSIESRQFIKALQLINALQSDFPPSPLVLALKALVYDKIVSKDEVLSICSDTKDHMFFDFASLPEVLATLDIVFQRLGRLDLATGYHEHACEKVHNSLELLRGLFNCYGRQSSFAKQLKVCLRMYMIVQEDKFLYWAVFCVQLQVLFHLFKKDELGLDHNLDEPEAFLVYMSVMERQEMYDPVREILCKLGPTLLVVKADKQDLKERKLLAHLCDYDAAVEAFKKILSLRSPNDWESLIDEFNFFVEDDSNCIYFACKISELPKKHCGSQILEALSNLENEKKICRFDKKDNDVFEEAIYEYFTRVDYKIQRFFQIFSKGEVYWLVDSLLKQDILTVELLKEKFSMMCNIPKIPKHFGDFSVGFKPAVHGAAIVIKTNKFIVIAADGELTSHSSDNALFLHGEKIRQFNDLCITITGVWKTLSKTVSVLHKCMRHLKKNDEGRRPTVRQITEYMAKEDPMLNGEFEVIICAFDELEVGKPLVPCASVAGNFFNWDSKQSFYCSGRCSSHAECILLEGKIGPDTGLAEVICWVERALVYMAMFDSCTGGLATITVIDADKKVKVMAKEYIHTTLWEKHRHFFENRKRK